MQVRLYKVLSLRKEIREELKRWACLSAEVAGWQGVFQEVILGDFDGKRQAR